MVAGQNFGAGDLLEIRLEGSRKTVLVPFNGEVIPEIDLDAGRLVVDPPAGLLDDEVESPGAESAGAEGTGDER